MLTLKAEKRNPDEKAKKLRRDGFITGVLYGKRNERECFPEIHREGCIRFYQECKRRHPGLSGTGW